MNVKCYYFQTSCSRKITKEHVISKCVLETVFGKPCQTLSSGEILHNQVLIDINLCTRDVCSDCNNKKLTKYDIAGAKFIRELSVHYDPTGLRIPAIRESIWWIIKTLLNFMRVIKDRQTNEFYPKCQDIKDSLIGNKSVPHDKIKLFVEGWICKEYFLIPTTVGKFLGSNIEVSNLFPQE